MSREIKFRAWDTNYNYFIAPDKLLPGLIWDVNGKQNSGQLTFPGAARLMQYTGLKDKNGVEIYEGDWFKPYNLVEPYALEVTWSDLGACFEPFGNSENSSIANLGEVIGNIYENPELLEASHD